MNIKEIKELIDAFSQYGINELEIERAGVRLRIRKDSSPVAGLSHPPASLQSDAPVLAASPSVIHEPLPPVGIPGAGDEDLTIVRSPIVGTFYRASKPDADVFVKIGDSVEPGHVLCIIEAMKLMNEIEAEVSGEIVKIYVENAESVEFGQALFGIRASRKS
jgi:acetyl-CoA carboxylase biotin carboxyl carrier protein